MKCKICGSDDVIKFGFNRLKRKKKQKYKCKKCGFIISNPKSLKGYRKPKRMMGRVIDLYNDGLSFYKIAYRMKISTKTAYMWFIKLSRRLKEIIQQKIDSVRRFSSTRHVDETELPIRKKKEWNLHIKKHEMTDQKVYLWAMIDNVTKFINCFHVTEKKDETCCQEFLEQSQSQQRPGYIISDNAFSYQQPIERIYNKGPRNWQKNKVKHIAIPKSDPKFKEVKGFNNLIERAFQTTKSRTKVTRRYKKIESIASLMFMFFLNYNFLKPHKTLNGQTPADAAGIGLGLKRMSFYDFMNVFGLH